MRYDKERIISEFNLSPFGAQGWLTNKDMPCPFCGKMGKWGVIFNQDGRATFHCWKCPRKVSVFEFLKKLGRLDLTKRSYSVKLNELEDCPKIGELQVEHSKWMDSDESEAKQELKPVVLPLRIKPLVDDPYLDSRGFKKEHYEEFEPSYTDTPLEPKLKNFIIFKMKVDGVCVAWWARSRYSKEWHKENLEAYKRHEADLVLRYRNSENNFQDLLGGCDELIEGKTETVIIVEGIFDKVNIDNLLGLQHLDDIKCCFTFGNNIGQGQINMMLKKGIKNVILLYDFGTINESKESALKMKELFDRVYVTAIRKPGIDPGNIDLEYLEEVLRGAVDPISFFYNKVEIKI
jgi:hypothetical protein